MNSLRSAQALAAALLVADANAQAQEASQKVTLAGDVLRTGHFADLIPGRPVASVYPDGRIDFYHSTFPLEVKADVS